MQIELMKLSDIKPYSNNTKLHPKEQIEQIKSSITEFGFNDPIAIDENFVIIEGHGRYIAATKLQFKEVPVIQLKHLNEQQKKAYSIAHNKLTMNSDFDLDKLKIELESLNDVNFDLELTGFDLDFVSEHLRLHDLSENKKIEEKLENNQTYDLTIECSSREELNKIKEKLKIKKEIKRKNLTVKSVELEI